MKLLQRMLCVPATLLATACSVAVRTPEPEPAPQTVELRNAAGERVGTARLTQEENGVRLVVEVGGLTPGRRGLHFHETGRCDPPDFQSAGGHFRPGGREHGMENPRGPHAGDLPNLVVGSDGSGRLETLNPHVSLRRGPGWLLDADGTALVLHVGADDYRTDPAGNSGDRVACAVIGR
jgi:superoxide dismutase, Cu-Zn family